MNLTVVVAVNSLKFHVLNFPLSNLNGKPECIDTYGDDRKERPFQAVAEKLECIAAKLNLVAADNSVLRFPFDETNFSPCKTKQNKECSYNDQSDLKTTDLRTFLTNPANKHNKCYASASHENDNQNHENPSTDKVQQATSKHAVIYLCRFVLFCHLVCLLYPCRLREKRNTNFYGTVIIQHKKPFVNKTNENFLKKLQKNKNFSPIQHLF